MIKDKKEIKQVRDAFKLFLFIHGYTLFSFCREFGEDYTTIWRMTNRAVKMDLHEMDRLIQKKKKKMGVKRVNEQFVIR